jgi:osmotically-inducible protein OsmY
MRTHQALRSFRNQETEMTKKGAISITLATCLLGASAITSSAFAADQANTTMEQRGEQTQSAVKDAWLHGKLESALLFNEHLNSFDIDTDVKNGTAYLRGAVESDIDRDLAGEIAKSIDGVANVENQLLVDSAKAKMAQSNERANERHGFKQSVLNATLSARVKTRLLANGNTQGTAIDVDSKDGVVTLSGSVESDQEKQLAVQIASNTSGAKSVSDQLSVEPTEEAE